MATCMICLTGEARESWAGSYRERCEIGSRVIATVLQLSFLGNDQPLAV